MNTNEVLKILRISRPTLYRYLDKEILKATKMSNSYYDFDEKTIYYLLNKDFSRDN